MVKTKISFLPRGNKDHGDPSEHSEKLQGGKGPQI